MTTTTAHGGLILPNSRPDGVPVRLHPTSDVTIVDKREQARQEAAQRAQVATNVRNTAGALWWANQGHHQRGDHVQAAQCHIARGRMLAEAKRQGIAV